MHHKLDALVTNNKTTNLNRYKIELYISIHNTHTRTHTNKCPLFNFILYSTNRSSIAIHVFIVMGTSSSKINDINNGNNGKKKHKKYKIMPPSIPDNLTAKETKLYIKEYRKEIDIFKTHLATLQEIHKGALSKTHIIMASRIAVDMNFTNHELRRAWIIFERLSSVCKFYFPKPKI